MINILDALKAKHPEATGDTIGEIIATMESSGGGGKNNLKAIPYFATPVPSNPKGFIKSINGPRDIEFYTFDEMWQLIEELGAEMVFTYPANSYARTLTQIHRIKIGDPEEGRRAIYADCIDLRVSENNEPKTTYIGVDHIGFSPSDGFSYERHEYILPLNEEDNITVKIIPFVIHGSESEPGGFIKGYDDSSATGYAYYTYDELAPMLEDGAVLYTCELFRSNEDSNQTLYRLYLDANTYAVTARSIAIDSIDFVGGDPAADHGECHITRREVSLSEENVFTHSYSTWMFTVGNAD